MRDVNVDLISLFIDYSLTKPEQWFSSKEDPLRWKLWWKTKILKIFYSLKHLGILISG